MEPSKDRSRFSTGSGSGKGRAIAARLAKEGPLEESFVVVPVSDPW